MKVITDSTDVINIILNDFPGINLSVTESVESYIDEHTDVILVHKDRVSDKILEFTKQPNKFLVYRENPT